MSELYGVVVLMCFLWGRPPPQQGSDSLLSPQGQGLAEEAGERSLNEHSGPMRGSV